MALNFDLDFDPAYGTAVEVFPGVRRVTARNPSAFTFHGTNTYLVGETTLAIIDPGPDDDEHLRNLLETIDARKVSHILVSHTHRDHSTLASRLAAATGAAVYAEGPHRFAKPGETVMESGADTAFMPDRRLGDGQMLEGDGWRLKAVWTPGHAANHMAFALDGTGILFSGDHVMGWSTTIVAPPDGSMADYMRSLDRLIERDDRLLLPGHGGPVVDPATYMLGLREHRLARESAILDRLHHGDRDIGAIVAAIYRDIDPGLVPAASLSTLAHLQDLVERGAVEADAEPSIGGIFRPV
jgi:glyoxylase-like metal-dependent hydrolase (beta-lactamase superfamily II)